MIKILPEALKSPNDPNNYRQIVLPNGLQVVLISDVKQMRKNIDIGITGSREEDDFMDEEDKELKGEGGEDDIEEEDDKDDGKGNDEEGDESEGDDDDDDDEDDDEDDDYEGEEEQGGERKAAAAMCVGVGSYFDPPYLQGLSHFLEHMLFMGTEKYPEENYYDSTLSKWGGYDNAYTEMEHTVFHFDVQQERFFQALDIFSQFFIAPLMKKDGTERELEAVESEFQLNFASDDVRLEQIFSHTAKPHTLHPFSSFGWGNKKSLQTTPAANNIDVHEELRKFYDQYYYAKNMRLVLIGGFSLDRLQERVVEMFSAVPSEPRVPPTLPFKHLPEEFKVISPLSKFGMPFAPEALSSVYRVVPVKNRHNLSLTWQLPPQFTNWRSDPTDYIGHLLGHEGSGSVLSALKRRGWASTIFAGIGHDGFTMASSHALFSVTVGMTEEGVEKWEDIVELVYSYIQMMKNIGGADGSKFPGYIFEELKVVGEFKFRFQEDEQPSELVEDLADELSPCHALPPEHLLDGSTLKFEFDGGEVMEIINKYLKCDNMRIDIMSSVFGRHSEYEGEGGEGGEEEEEEEGEKTLKPPTPPPKLPPYLNIADQIVEPIFGTRFWRSKLEPETVGRFDSPNQTSDLHLPEPNPYLPESFSMKSLPSDDAAHPMVGSIVKVADLKTKAKTFYSGSIMKFDSTKNKLLVSYEDEDKAWYNVDNNPAFFTQLKNDDSFAVEGGKFKVKIVTLLEAGGLGEDGLRFGDGGDDDMAEYDVVFPPIPPPTEEGRMPKLAFDQSSCRIYHLQDRLFNRPNAELRLRVMASINRNSPLECVVADIMSMLLGDSTVETVYMASLCELDCCISSNGHDGYFSFRVHGFDDKLPRLTEFLIGMFLAFRDGGEELPSFVGDGRFEVILEVLGRRYDNSHMGASSFATELRIRHLMPGRPSELDKKKELEGMTVVKFMEVAGKLLKNIAVLAFFHGNTNVDDVKKCGHMLVCLLKGKKGNSRGGGGGLPIKSMPVDRIAKLEAGKVGHILVSSKNECDKNTAVEHYYQIGSDNIDDLVLTALLVQLIDEPFFDNVRTKEQFGYSVSCSERWTGGIIGFVLRIVSSVKTAEQCSLRIDTFLDRFVEDALDPMKKEVFLENIVGLAKNKLQAWTTLSEHTNHLFSEITCYRKNFDIHRDEVVKLRTITKEMVKVFFQTKVIGKGSRVLKVQVIGDGGGEKRDRSELEVELKEEGSKAKLYDAVYKFKL